VNPRTLLSGPQHWQPARLPLRPYRFLPPQPARILRDPPRRGIARVERVLTDNGPCYRGSQWRQICKHNRTAHKRTRPYRPQTDSKVERFHRILIEEWAYIRHWTSETQCHHAYTGFIHYYNHNRSHGALNWATPASTLQDNLPERHN